MTIPLDRLRAGRLLTRVRGKKSNSYPMVILGFPTHVCSSSPLSSFTYKLIFATLYETEIIIQNLQMRKLRLREITLPKAVLVAQAVNSLSAAGETWVRSPGREDPLEEGTATHSRILAWRIPWTEEPGGLRSTGVAKSKTRLSNQGFHFHFLFSKAQIFSKAHGSWQQ